MSGCKLCGKDEEGLSLLSAYHKELGRMWVCQECWVDLYENNSMVGGCTGSGGTSCPSCR